MPRRGSPAGENGRGAAGLPCAPFRLCAGGSSPPNANQGVFPCLAHSTNFLRRAFRRRPSGYAASRWEAKMSPGTSGGGGSDGPQSGAHLRSSRPRPARQSVTIPRRSAGTASSGVGWVPGCTWNHLCFNRSRHGQGKSTGEGDGGPGDLVQHPTPTPAGRVPLHQMGRRGGGVGRRHPRSALGSATGSSPRDSASVSGGG